MIIIGTGSRDWADVFPIRHVMMNITEEYREFTYYHGNARGFDILSVLALKKLKHYDIKAFPAEWNLHGKAAGMMRNRQMLAEALLNESPENILLIAMPLENSIGTFGCISICKQAGITVRVYDKQGNLIQ